MRSDRVAVDAMAAETLRMNDSMDIVRQPSAATGNNNPTRPLTKRMPLLATAATIGVSSCNNLCALLSSFACKFRLRGDFYREFFGAFEEIPSNSRCQLFLVVFRW